MRKQLPIGMLALATTTITIATACAQQPTAPRGQTSSAMSVAAGNTAVTKSTTIILVHGAWADATGWQEIIPILQGDGYKVRAVQNSLTSLPNDVATTKRMIDAETKLGPVVVVAHSYGGTVVSEAAAGNPNVKALVFLSAFTPDAGEPFGRFLPQYPTPLGNALQPDAAGFVFIDPAQFPTVFAGGVQERQARVMAVTQKPLFGEILGQAPAAAAWHTIPSWYLVTLDDQAISPDLQRLYAQRMKAHISEIHASHVSFITRPQEVAKFILEAVTSVSN